MTVQVLTNENMVEFIQNRTVPEFKPPEAPKADAAKPAEVAKEAPRDDAGKFVKQDSTPEAEKPAAEKQATQVAEDDDLSEASEAIRKKIDKLIAKKHRAMKEAEEFGRDEARRALAAEARADDLAKQIEALRGQQKSEGPSSVEGADKEPDQKDFETVGEYAKAYLKWERKQEREAEKAERARESQTAEQTKAQQRLIAQVAEARKQYPDYAEVMQAVKWEAPSHVATFIIESDNGARMAYHLAKDADAYNRIVALSPTRAVAELGKLEDKLFGEAKAPEVKPKPADVSKAPPPIEPLEAKTTPVVKDPKDMSFAELRAYRDSQKRDGKWRAY